MMARGQPWQSLQCQARGRDAQRRSNRRGRKQEVVKSMLGHQTSTVSDPTAAARLLAGEGTDRVSLGLKLEYQFRVLDGPPAPIGSLDYVSAYGAPNLKAPAN